MKRNFKGGTAALLAVLSIDLAGCAHVGNPVAGIFSRSRRQAETQLNMARLHERQGHLQEARKLYDELYQKDPKNTELLHRMAVVASREGNHQRADDLFLQAVRQDPHNSKLLADMGYALYLQQDLKGAEHALRQSLAEDPQNRSATNNLAIVLGHQGQFDESYQLFRSIVTEAEANANIAYIHTQRGEGKAAMERYSKALTLDSQLKPASNALVQIAEMQQRAEAAHSKNEQQTAASERQPILPTSAQNPSRLIDGPVRSADETLTEKAGRARAGGASTRADGSQTQSGWLPTR
jgi:Tfp pilus assembly protein PilF